MALRRSSSLTAPLTVLMRHVSPSLASALADFQTTDAGPIDTARACAQHELYAQALRSNPAVGRVVELPADARLPDSVFVEDVAVALPHGSLLLAAPRARGRQDEPEAMLRDLPPDLLSRCVAHIGPEGPLARTLRLGQEDGATHSSGSAPHAHTATTHERVDNADGPATRTDKAHEKQKTQEARGQSPLGLTTTAEAAASDAHERRELDAATSASTAAGDAAAVQAAFGLRQLAAAQHYAQRRQAQQRLEGGDVMQVGAVAFVGLSTRTNRAGADALTLALARIAPGQVVAPVPVPLRTLHLKSAVTWGGPEVGFFVADSADGRATWDALQGAHKGALAAHAHNGGTAVAAARAIDWRVTWVPDALGSNVLRIGNVLYWNAAASAATRTLFEGLRVPGVEVVPLDMGELAKLDGALTCCSVVLEGSDADQ